MNNNFNIPYIPINVLNHQIYEELKKLNFNLEKIQNYLENEKKGNEKKYLKKEDTYHML